MNAREREVFNKECDRIGEPALCGTGRKYKNKISAIKFARSGNGFTGLLVAKHYIDMREILGRFPYAAEFVLSLEKEIKARQYSVGVNTALNDAYRFFNLSGIMENAEVIDGPKPSPFVFPTFTDKERDRYFPRCDFNRECDACDRIYNLNPEFAFGNAWKYCPECRKVRPFKAPEKLTGKVIDPEVQEFARPLEEKYPKEVMDARDREWKLAGNRV